MGTLDKRQIFNTISSLVKISLRLRIRQLVTGCESSLNFRSEFGENNFVFFLHIYAASLANTFQYGFLNKSLMQVISIESMQPYIASLPPNITMKQVINEVL